MENYSELLRIVWQEYDALAGQVATEMRDFGEESKTSDYEVLRDPWEEFALQVQEEESVLFDAYELTIRQIGAKILEAQSLQDIVLLWALTDGALDSEDDFLSRSDMEGTIMAKLGEHVRDLAIKEDLVHYYRWREEQVEAEEAEANKELEDACDVNMDSLLVSSENATSLPPPDEDFPLHGGENEPSLFD